MVEKLLHTIKIKNNKSNMIINYFYVFTYIVVKRDKSITKINNIYLIKNIY